MRSGDDSEAIVDTVRGLERWRGESKSKRKDKERREETENIIRN